MNNKSFIVLTQTVFSSVGGALIVYSSYDDAPGGVLIGLIMILFSLSLAFKLKQCNGNSSLNVSLTYLCGLEVTELKEEDISQ